MKYKIAIYKPGVTEPEHTEIEAPDHEAAVPGGLDNGTVITVEGPAIVHRRYEIIDKELIERAHYIIDPDPHSHFRKIVELEIGTEIEGEDLMTLTEAAEHLDVALPTMSQAVSAGRYTTIVDSQAQNPQKGRRLVLREEVEKAKESRG